MYKLKTSYIKLLADTMTPVGLYLRMRDKFVNTILLESSDYHGNEHSFSYICCEPISTFTASGNNLTKQFPGGSSEVINLENRQEVVDELSSYISSFEVETYGFNFLYNGFFGYMSYDAVQSFEEIDFSKNDNYSYKIPEVRYALYKYVLAIDHFKNELFVFEHSLEGDEKGIEEIKEIIHCRSFPSYGFEATDEETSNYTDEQFLEILKKGREHCFRGDVFQIVLSRQFRQKFSGDEFNVYRALRSINPSPYLFYFDYGDYKIFGSSPEAQIVVKNGKATIYPIAGTFKRTGNDSFDGELAKKLYDDPKENSEHVMLVDLARNDLSKSSDNVEVEVFKEIQYFSHVIHLVSKVTGELIEGKPAVQMAADTFPAGTLSGAPKYKAMELINTYENVRRGFYGGAIGYLGFNNDFNHAIMIRSFLSKHNQLYFQGGAGVVAKSVIESELQEVNNKVAALKQSIVEATQMTS